MYKAVFIDLDGTLLDDEKNISKENKEAVKNTINKGVLVCICSGRPKQNAIEFKNEVNASRYIIYSNGSGIYDADMDEDLALLTVPEELCLDLYKKATSQNMFFRIDTKYGRYVNEKREFLRGETLFSKDLETFLSEEEALQVAIASKNMEEIDELEKYINEKINSGAKIIHKFNLRDTYKDQPDLYVLNIINENASKGNAINGLCKYLNIDINDVIAVGDDQNDISMLKNVGLGVAMGNAFDNIKKYAKEVTKTNNENGVAEVLIKNFS